MCLCVTKYRAEFVCDRGRGLLKQELKGYIAELTFCFAILSLVGALKSKRIEYILEWNLDNPSV